MTHDELLAKIDFELTRLMLDSNRNMLKALRAVVELHKPIEKTWPSSGNLRITCKECEDGFADYPCPTIQAIEKELK